MVFLQSGLLHHQKVAQRHHCLSQVSPVRNQVADVNHPKTSLMRISAGLFTDASRSGSAGTMVAVAIRFPAPARDPLPPVEAVTAALYPSILLIISLLPLYL
jgi:hypothetical protein